MKPRRQRDRPRPLLWACLLMVEIGCLHASQGFAADNDAAWRKRLEEEAPRAWKKYQERASKLQGAVTIVTSALGPKGGSTETRVELKQSPDCALVDELQISQNGKTLNNRKVRAVNPRYGFSLRRRGNVDGWMLSDLNFRPTKKLRFPSASFWVTLWTTYPVTFAFESQFMVVTLEEPGFSVKSVRPVPYHGKECVKVELEWRGQPSKMAPGQKRFPFRGWVIFDPESYWVIREYDIFNYEWPFGQRKLSGTLAYRESSGFPLLARTTLRHEIFGDEPRTVVHTYTLDLREQHLAEEDFTMSAFGLPEPKGAPPLPKTPWFLYIALTAGGLALVAMWFFRRARKAREAQAA